MKFNVKQAPEMPASFTEDYLNSMTRRELMQKYNIGSSRCNTWVRNVYEKTHVKPPVKRRRQEDKGLPRYVTRYKEGYKVCKKIDGRTYYYGVFDTIGEAEEKIRELEENNWRRK